MILYLYRMTAVTIQELSQSQNVFNSILEQRPSLTTSFFSVLKNGTSWMLKSEIYHLFSDSKKSLLIYFKADKNSIFMFISPWVLSFWTGLDIILVPWININFRHNFRDTVDLFCLCNGQTKTTSHYLLRCLFFIKQKTKLLESSFILTFIKWLWCRYCKHFILYGSPKCSFFTNNKILLLTVEFLKCQKRFDKPLFWIASTFHGHLMSFQRPWDVYVLSLLTLIQFLTAILFLKII